MEGIYVYALLIHFLKQKLAEHCKALLLQLKKKKKKTRKINIFLKREDSKGSKRKRV